MFGNLVLENFGAMDAVELYLYNLVTEFDYCCGFNAGYEMERI